MSESLPEKQKQALEALQDDDMATGLEDFAPEDQVMPRLNISHPDAEFVDNLSGQKYSKLSVIMLGLVKQRVMWAAEVDEGDRPLCKSVNFTEGLPNVNEFPYSKTPFEKGQEQLDCATCPLKEWGTHPQRETPWCSEQHTFPLLMVDEDGNPTAPALLTLQRSGIKPSRAYLSSFARDRRPLFTVFTNIELTPQKRGSVNYAVPRFSQGQPTDPDQWQAFAQHFKQVRSFLQTPPTTEEESSSASDGDGAQKAPAAPSAAADDDDLPF